MKIGLTSVRAYVFAVGFVLLPVLAALVVMLLTGGAGQSERAKPYFLGGAVVALALGVLFFERMRRFQKQRASQPPRPGTADEVVTRGAAGLACFAGAEAFLVATIDWRAAAVYVALVVAWVLVWTPRSNRQLVVRSTIGVSCTPLAAFELVSNPNKWPLYVPELELVQPVEIPVRLGTVVHDRVRRGGVITLEADEEVVALEPGVRFGTAIRGPAQSSSGIYQFAPVQGGTTIEFTHRSLISLPAAILGVATRRGSLRKVLGERRAATFARIKRLLEEPEAGSV